MKYRQLGRSGLWVSVVGLGTNQFGGKVDEKGVAEIIDAALDLGVNFIDTADVYTGGKSEETIGKAIAKRRDQVVLATKVGSRTGDGPNDVGASRRHIIAGVEASLRRLGTEYIDLYQIHRFDPHTPFEETMRALDDLVRSGKVRYIGASNYAAWQLCRANDVAEMRGWTPFISIQPHYHMLERSIEKELVPYCEAFGVGIIPYFPLAGGFLTGKYRRVKRLPRGRGVRRAPTSNSTSQSATSTSSSGWRPLPKQGARAWPSWPSCGSSPGPRWRASSPASHRCAAAAQRESQRMGALPRGDAGDRADPLLPSRR